MTSDTESPVVYVIAGPNGAGKTTFATEFLPRYVACFEFLNADLIAAGLSPFAPETQALRSSDLMLQRMDELVQARKSFSFETTLAARSYRNRFIQWQRLGYRTHLFFLCLPLPALAVSRVANRVLQGGHNVPEPTIRLRFARGIENFHRLYCPIVDRWEVYDASQLPPSLIAQSSEGRIDVSDHRRWQQVIDHGNESR